jgi:hypothetical protein
MPDDVAPAMRPGRPMEAVDIEEQNHASAAHLPEHVAAPIRADQAVEALRNGPRGALVIAGIAVAILFIGWLAFYFLLFLPRGPIG